jgi:tRNA U34 5-carboxymethylaminomethyl modifying GTPase MnmE/TrmE
MDIEAALSALGELDGRAVTEEVVNGIFSHFCVGK